MAEIRLAYSNHIRFVLQDEIMSSRLMEHEPIGWQDDELEIKRDKKYHGIFTQFSNSLKFKNEYKDYILECYERNGLNSNLYLLKYRLKKVPNTYDPSVIEIKWALDYIGLADFETMVIDKDALAVNFTSNDLEALIKAHETDVFELEREDSIDDVPISRLFKQKLFIEGRTLTSRGESDVIETNDGWVILNENHATVRTELITQGHPRHSSVDIAKAEVNMSNGTANLNLASNMFFVDDVVETETIDINIKIHAKFLKSVIMNSDYPLKVSLQVWEYNQTNYTLVEDQLLYTATPDNVWHEFQTGTITKTLTHKQGLVLLYRTAPGMFTNFILNSLINKVEINVTSYADGSPDISFLFVNDAISRLMEIITGKRKKFYSKIFGRIPYRSHIKEFKYNEDGEYGYIGLTSGFWVRAFDPSSEKYKGMQLSIKDAFESIQNMFNVGIAIENIDMEQRVRCEDLTHFYRNEVVVDLTGEVSKYKRKIDKDLFFSGTTVGCDKGGDYENEIGLDEPNTQTSTVTPLRKTDKKFQRISKIRADDYGMEIIRRKPELLFPDEDTSQDEHNWFLDTKPTEGSKYTQKKWFDRLQELPTGVLSPETYKGMLFTPYRILKRHGWVLRAGMEQLANVNKYIKYISSVANTSLSMKFIGEDRAVAENEDILVKDLDRPRFLPWEVEFTHPVDDDLMDKILGTTPVFIKGEWENVPNVYFKFRYTNPYTGEAETGYLLELKPNKTGKFKMQLCNENINF